jgi:hypothetical protein
MPQSPVNDANETCTYQALPATIASQAIHMTDEVTTDEVTILVGEAMILTSSTMHWVAICE